VISTPRTPSTPQVDEEENNFVLLIPCPSSHYSKAYLAAGHSFRDPVGSAKNPCHMVTKLDEKNQFGTTILDLAR